MTDPRVAAQLREWAGEDLSRPSAVEILIRTGLAEGPEPWMLQDRAWHTRTIDFDTIEDWIHFYTGTHASVLRIAASLANGLPVSLREEAMGLDRVAAELVMTAIAHTETDSAIIEDDVDDPLTIPVPPLALWPEQR